MLNENLNVMRTAILTAYPKIFSDISFSHQIFHQALLQADVYGFSFKPDMFVNEMAVEIEARYKGVSKALQRQIKNQKDVVVIEIAAGLSPRSLEFGKVCYVESDLKPVCNLKKQIFKKLNYNDKAKNIFAVDLTNNKTLKNFLLKVSSLGKFKKVIIVSEGLFWYLKRSDIESIAEIFKQTFGKNLVWISADCPTISVADSERKQYRKTISDSANSKRNTFNGESDFIEFFKTLGFDVLTQNLSSLVSAKEIKSGKTFSLTEPQVKNRIDSYVKIAIIK